MKISKHIAVLLSMLLLASNIGLAFNVHYCGGSIASITITTPNNDFQKGCCQKAEKKASCCKDKKVKMEKKTDNSVVKTFSFQLQIPFAPLKWQPALIVTSPLLENKTTAAFYCNSNAPPLYKLYAQYIFYA